MIAPIVLCILDGWGLAPSSPGNAISLAHAPVTQKLWRTYPHTTLEASGSAVGLPPEEDGNTETGHLNIGAGRVVYQDLPRINMAISDGSFFQNPALVGALTSATQHSSNIHLLGLLSDSGVHASRDHLYALLTMIKHQAPQSAVYLHLFTDGRDSPPTSGGKFVAEVEAKCAELGIGKIATIMGRYYAMDRDRRWDRTKRAYEALTQDIEKHAISVKDAIVQAYTSGKTDEFIEPTIILDPQGAPYPRIKNHDSVIFYNYRIDRPRQLTRAFVLSNFEDRIAAEAFDPYSVKYFHKHVVQLENTWPFTRTITLPNLYFVTMTEYDHNLPCMVAFPPQKIADPIGSVFAAAGAQQLRISETEKERFVTFYFNGYRESPYPGEDRLIIPSPTVATYDLTPAMSAAELTDKLIDRLALGMYAFVVVNFANPDMVAHTGNIPAAVKACEITDECIGKIVDKVLAMGGTCVITGDHGNVEEMLGVSGEMDTEHSTYPVPFIMVSKTYTSAQELPKGILADIAPTILAYANLPIPTSMTGRNLLERGSI